MSSDFPDPELEYDVVTAGSLYDLTIAVNKRLSDGWKLLGGMAAEGGCKYQAMTRENPKLISDDDPDADEYLPQEMTDHIKEEES